MFAGSGYSKKRKGNSSWLTIFHINVEANKICVIVFILKSNRIDFIDESSENYQADYAKIYLDLKI